MADRLHWWQNGIIYQLLVPSYLDSNGDGYGDLRGILQRLDYLQWLGIRAIWLSPVYPSPLADLGYDVSDYVNIAPEFGTLGDFEELVDQAHRRDLKIILDWVPNHTSDQHPWFLESRASRDNPKRDWYIWRDAGPEGSPPNNWISVFGGSVWEWDKETSQFYLHTFLNRQPDLNWRNPEVRTAMFDTLRFWLDKGVDGFRIDALDLLMKDEQFRDNPPNPDFQEGEGPDGRLLPHHTRDQPGIHEIVAAIRTVADEFEDRMLAGELYLPVDKVITYYGDDKPELHLPFHMQLAWTDWTADDLCRSIGEYLAQVPPHGWPSWIISTHDCLRLAMRCQGEQARVAAMLLLTLPGTPVHYYGEEVGMKGVPIPAEHAVDPQGRRTGRNRDPERTPMQWNDDRYAGFSTREPWLPVADDVHTANVTSQRDNPHSLLNLYRKLFGLRREFPVLVGKGLDALEVAGPVLSYRRTGPDGKVLILLNMSDKPSAVEREAAFRGRICLSTFLDREQESVRQSIHVRENEGLLIRIES